MLKNSCGLENPWRYTGNGSKD